MENNSTIKYIVYCTTNIENKKIYVGYHKTDKPYDFDGYIGNNVYVNRPSTYNRCLTYFQRAVHKYGPSKFIRKTLAIFDNEEDALELEGQIVNKDFLKRNDVYNTALGGIGGSYYITCIKVYQYDETGMFINEYDSIMTAARTVNRNHSSIWRAIKNKNKCASFFWTKNKYDKLNLSLMKSYEGLNTIPVFQYSNEGNYECCYNSIRDAGRILNIHDANISKAIKLGIICKDKYFTSVYADTFSIAKSDQINHHKVYQYDLDGNFIAEYENANQAKKVLNISGNIYQSIKLNNLCGGFQWKFEKFDKIEKIKSKSGRKRKIGKYDKDWNLIEIYDSLAECKRQNGAACEHVIRGRNDFHKGFRYKYED